MEESSLVYSMDECELMADLKTKHGTNVEMFLVFLVSGFTKCLKLLLKVNSV